MVCRFIWIVIDVAIAWTCPNCIFTLFARPAQALKLTSIATLCFPSINVAEHAPRFSNCFYYFLRRLSHHRHIVEMAHLVFAVGWRVASVWFSVVFTFLVLPKSIFSAPCTLFFLCLFRAHSAPPSRSAGAYSQAAKQDVAPVSRGKGQAHGLHAPSLILRQKFANAASASGAVVNLSRFLRRFLL